MNQSYRNFGIIDDGSKDDSSEVILDVFNARGFKDFKIIRNDNNRGLTKSLNVGLGYCSGEYIARIDADDEWNPLKLERQLSFMHKKNLGWSCTRFESRNNDTSRLMVSDVNAFPYSNPYIHSSLLIEQNLLESVGGYNENYKYSQDYFLYANLYHYEIEGGIVQEILGTRHISSGIIGVRRRRQQIFYLIKGQFYCLRKNIGKRQLLLLSIGKNVLRLILNQKSIDVFKGIWRI